MSGPDDEKETVMPRHDETVRIGRGDLEVTRLGLGTAPLGGMFRPVPDQEATALVVAAWNAGIRYFDTAPFYGHGVAERRLGAGLRAAGSPPAVVSTKVGRLLVAGAEPVPGIFTEAAPEQPVFDYSADGVRASVESSLERLGLDHVDAVLIHDPDDFEEEALAHAYPALERLRSEGAVQAIGIGMNQCRIPARFVRETDIDFVLIAGRYTLLDQEAQEDLLPAAEERGVGILAAGVFNSGILADPRPGATYNYEPAAPELVQRALAIRAVLEEYDVPLTAAALQFPLRHSAVRAVLTGARNPEELSANIADFDRTVPDQCWKALEESGLVAALRP